MPIEPEQQCPTCGSELQQLPTLDGSGYVGVCPSCSLIPAEETAEAPEAVPDPEPGKPSMGSRFRELIQPTDFQSLEDIPDDLIELPEETKTLLADRLAKRSESSTSELSQSVTSSLRDRGYVLSEDSRGLRISGMPYTGRGNTAELSPNEVVRMAAELEGGTKDLAELRECPHCQAKVQATASICQWCGQSVGASARSDSEPDSDSGPNPP